MAADLVWGGAQFLFSQVFLLCPPMTVAAVEGMLYRLRYKGAVPSHTIPNVFPKVLYPNYITLAVRLQS